MNKKYIKTERASHNHYRVYYLQNASDDSEYPHADQQFMDVTQSAARHGWFVEIKQSERYFGPEAHVWRNNPYTTDVKDQGVVKDYLTTENDIDITLPKRIEYNKGDMVRYYDRDADYFDEDGTPMYNTNPLLGNVVKVGEYKQEYKIESEGLVIRVPLGRIVCLAEDRKPVEIAINKTKHKEKST